MSEDRSVDHAAIRTGQVLAMAMLMAAYALDRWELVAALATVFAVTATHLSFGPFALLYRWLLRPAGLVRPDVRVDNPHPHQFGQAVGALSAGLAAFLLYAHFEVAGWILVWVLIVLTAISFAGWCIGCFLYYQLNRLGLGGFFAHPPTDREAVLGARPRKGIEPQNRS